MFFRNFIVNGLNFFVKVLMGMFIPPIIVKFLGIEEFGLVQIAMNIATFTAILSNSLNQANNRYVAIEYLNNNKEGTTSILTTIFFLYFTAIFVLIGLIGVISVNVDKLFDFNSNIKYSVSWLFFLVGLSQFFIMTNSALGGPIYAKNRLDILQGINLFRNVTKGILIYLLLLLYESLISVGMAFFIPSLLSLVVSFFFFRKFVPYYKFNIRKINLQKAKDVLILSSWSILAIGGNILFTQSDVILVNFFVGAEKSGEYALLVQWNVLIISIATVLSVVIAPSILRAYALNESERAKDTLLKSIRYIGIFLVIPFSIVFVYAEEILNYWVGSDYIFLADYLRILIINTGLTQATRLFHTISLAFNRLKGYSFISLLFGSMHILMSILLFKYTTLGMYGIVLSNSIMSFLLHIIFLPNFINTFLPGIKYKIWIKLLNLAVIDILIVGVCWMIKNFLFMPTNFTSFVFSISVVIVLISFILFVGFIKGEERQRLFHFLENKLNENI